MESSKATACHIKHVAGDTQAVEINLMRHQYTESHQENTRRENLLLNQNNQVTRMFFMRNPMHQAIARRVLILEMHTRVRIGVQNVEIWTFH